MDKGAKAIVAVIAADKTPPVRDSVEYDFSRELLFSMSSLPASFKLRNCTH